MPSSRLILNKPEPRHLLLGRHGVRQTPKPPSFAVPASVGSRISIDNLASTNTQPERPQSPLSQKPFLEYSSADSKASAPHGSDDGKWSPTPSVREKLGPFNDFIDRAEKYLGLITRAKEAKRRLKGFWRREATADPKRLAEFHAGLVQREAAYQALRKKMDRLALQDHALEEGLMSAPASHASSTQDIRERMRVTALIDSQTLETLTEEGQRKRGHQPTLSEGQQELQLRAKRSVPATTSTQQPGGREFLYPSDASSTPAELQTALPKERQLEIVRLVEVRQGKLPQDADLNLFHFNIARELGITIQDIRASQHTAEQERLALPGSSTQARQSGRLTEHGHESPQGHFFDDDGDFQMMDDAPNSGASSPRQEGFGHPDRSFTDPTHTTSIPNPPRINVTDLGPETPRQIPQRKPSIEILRREDGSIRLLDPVSRKKADLKKVSLPALQHLRRNRDSAHSHRTLAENSGQTAVSASIISNDFRQERGIVGALTKIGRLDDLTITRNPSSREINYQWRPYEDGYSHAERILTDETPVTAALPWQAEAAQAPSKSSAAGRLFFERRADLEALADGSKTRTEVGEILTSRFGFPEITPNAITRVQKFLPNLRFKDDAVVHSYVDELRTNRRNSLIALADGSNTEEKVAEILTGRNKSPMEFSRRNIVDVQNGWPADWPDLKFKAPLITQKEEILTKRRDAFLALTNGQYTRPEVAYRLTDLSISPTVFSVASISAAEKELLREDPTLLIRFKQAGRSNTQ